MKPKALGYEFDPLVDPRNPIDPVNNPPPPEKFWKSVDFDTDSEIARYGKYEPSIEYMQCAAFEKRELELLAERNNQPPKAA